MNLQSKGFVVVLSLMLLATCMAPEVKAACDYTYANQNGGWGYDPDNSSNQCPPGGNNSNSGGESGNGEVIAVRVSWPANPGSEGVDRYHVQYSKNGGGWIDGGEVYNTVEKTFGLGEYGIEVGINFCARVRAGTHNEWSPYSNQSCVTIPDERSTSPTQPGNPTMTLIRG